MGPEAAAQGFTEAAELEALQIDKNDLKLVFGRPFARGRSSEVYQVTHAGKNRAAKVSFDWSVGRSVGWAVGLVGGWLFFVVVFILGWMGKTKA